MKVVSSLLMLFSLAAVWAQEAWQASDTFGLLNSWNSVAYGDGVYIAVNGFGRIARSTDGGQSFTEVLNTGWILEDVEYGSNGTTMAFWATGRGGSGDLLYESTDGGQTWTDIAANFPFLFTEGGADIVLDAAGNLVYTKLRGNNNFSDAFLYDGTYYVYGGGPESSIRTSANGTDYTVVVENSGLWLLGGIQLGSNALVYGTLFEEPGNFSTRKGAIFELTTDPTAPINPIIIENSVNTYVSDIDMDPATPTTLHATGANALLTSTDNGATWTADEVTSGNVADMSEMAVGDGSRVAVGAAGIVYIGSGNGGGDTWGGLPIVDGYVDTGSWLGWIQLTETPYVYSLTLNGWLYFPEPETDAPGAWIYILR